MRQYPFRVSEWSPRRYRLRRADAADAAALHALAALTFPLACPPHTTAESVAAHVARHLSAERFAGYLADPRHVLIVADDAGLLVGYTMVVAGEPGDPEVAAAVTVRPTAELSKCYVHPDHLGSGLAAALVDRTVDVARQLGAAAVCLGVNAQNARANRFYDKCGFVVVGTRRFVVGDQVEDDLVRERIL